MMWYKGAGFFVVGFVAKAPTLVVEVDGAAKAVRSFASAEGAIGSVVRFNNVEAGASPSLRLLFSAKMPTQLRDTNELYHSGFNEVLYVCCSKEYAAD